MKNLACNVKYASEKAHFISKLRSWYFVFIAHTEIISMSQEVANLSLIQLIGSTDLHPNNTQTKKWQKK